MSFADSGSSPRRFNPRSKASGRSRIHLMSYMVGFYHVSREKNSYSAGLALASDAAAASSAAFFFSTICTEMIEPS